jgi:hypothetical protein
VKRRRPRDATPTIREKRLATRLDGEPFALAVVTGASPSSGPASAVGVRVVLAAVPLPALAVRRRGRPDDE